MSYETVTLRGDCFPSCCEVRPTRSRFTSLGIVPIAAPAVFKAVAGNIIGKILGGGAAKARFRAEAQAFDASLTPEQLAVNRAQTRARFAAAGLGTGLSRILSRAFPESPTGVKLGRRVTPLPRLTQPVVDPVVMTPVPDRSAQAVMSVPASMAEMGPASGGGAESLPESNGAATPAPGMDPKMIGALLVGGLVLFALSRRRNSGQR